MLLAGHLFHLRFMLTESGAQWSPCLPNVALVTCATGDLIDYTRFTGYREFILGVDYCLPDGINRFESNLDQSLL